MSKKYLYPIEFLILFIVFFVLSHASINNLIFPFAIGCAFALVFCGIKVWLVIPSYALSILLFNFSTGSVISTASVIFFLILPFVVHKLSKKTIKIWIMCVFLGLSQAFKMIFIDFTITEVVFIVLSILVSELFFVALIKVFNCVKTRSWMTRFTNAEFVCASFLIVVLSDGLSVFAIGKFEIVKLFVALLILTSCCVFKRDKVVLLGSLLAFGTILSSGNTILVAPILIWSLCVMIFKTNNKILSSLAIVVAEGACGYLLNLYYSFGIVEFLPVLISSAFMVVVPNKFFDKIKMIAESQNARIALKGMYNQGKELIGRRLESLSNVFYEMNLVFKAMLKKSLSEEDVKVILYKEVKKKVCENCPEKARCHRTFYEDTSSSFDEMISIAFKKGKISLLDVPSFLNSRCNKVNQIIPAINSLCVQYKKYSEIMGSLDVSKLLIADQLYGISNVIKNLSKEIAINVSFDNVREEKIKEELCFNNIICTDAIVYDKDIHTKEVSIVVRNEDENSALIPSVVSGICGMKMIISNRDVAVQPGWTNLTLKTSPKYDCIFGISVMAKAGNEKSGDCHSEIRLNENKFLFALCDGMGNGEKARETSTIAIGLIENFYKAGFDNETILSSVNKLLVLQREENFSAIDICVVDLSSGIIDVVKMGGPNGYLLSKNEIKEIDGGSLPLGIVGEGKPIIKKYVIEENEFLIMMSDGVSDGYASGKVLCDFISRIKTTNPQEISDLILKKALENNGGRAVDDMSVLVIKIFNV